MSNLMMPSRVLLYGRVIQGLNIDNTVFDRENGSGGGLAGLGMNRFLREQFDPEGEAGIANAAVAAALAEYVNSRSAANSEALAEAVAAAADVEGPNFAMIYGFEYEAHYHDLMAPTIMLVHGEGVDIHRGRGAQAVGDAVADAIAATAAAASEAMSECDGSTSPAELIIAATRAAAGVDTDFTPVAETAAEADDERPYVGRVERPFPGFEDAVRVWPYDKADFSMRLDPCTGPIESILLEAELDDQELAYEMAGRKVSGRKVGGYLGRGRKVSGRKVGISGRKLHGD